MPERASRPEATIEIGRPAEGDLLSRSTVHDLLGHLAIIKGHAQLLRRRLGGVGTTELDRSLASLATIEQSINDLAAALNALRSTREDEDEGAPAEAETATGR